MTTARSAWLAMGLIALCAVSHLRLIGFAVSELRHPSRSAVSDLILRMRSLPLQDQPETSVGYVEGLTLQGLPLPERQERYNAAQFALLPKMVLPGRQAGWVIVDDQGSASAVPPDLEGDQLEATVPGGLRLYRVAPAQD